jgi:hypothetical protein
LLERTDLYVAREALVKDRTAAKSRGKVLTLSLLEGQNAQRLEPIDRQIPIVEAAILQIVEADASLSDRFGILTSIPGVSNITAFTRRARSRSLPLFAGRSPYSISLMFAHQMIVSHDDAPTDRGEGRRDSFRSTPGDPPSRQFR